MGIDVQGAIETAEELLAGLRELDGTEPDDAPTRAARRQRVELNRAFLYLAHLGERARVQVMDAYYVYKAHHDPVDVGGPDER
jgi:hypothetical protein